MYALDARNCWISASNRNNKLNLERTSRMIHSKLLWSHIEYIDFDTAAYIWCSLSLRHSFATVKRRPSISRCWHCISVRCVRSPSAPTHQLQHHQIQIIYMCILAIIFPQRNMSIAPRLNQIKMPLKVCEGRLHYLQQYRNQSSSMAETNRRQLYPRPTYACWSGVVHANSSAINIVRAHSLHFV